jgi:hypothetical protein
LVVADSFLARIESELGAQTTTHALKPVLGVVDVANQ